MSRDRRGETDDARDGSLDELRRRARAATIAALVELKVAEMFQRGEPIRDLDAFRASWRTIIREQASAGLNLRERARQLGLDEARELARAEYEHDVEQRRETARRAGARWCGGRCGAWTPNTAGRCGWCGEGYV